MRLRKCWRIDIDEYDDPCYIFAPSGAKAKGELYHSTEGIEFQQMRCRRAHHRDVRLPDPDPIAQEMSEKERHCLLHAFGGNGDPYTAGYRDYFYTTFDDPPLVSLTNRGLMRVGKIMKDDMAYFTLTPNGKEVALSLTPEYRR